MNILYLGSPATVHDLKWITYFSADNRYNVFLITERNARAPVTPAILDVMKDKQIHFKGEIEPYSVLKPFSFRRSVKKIRRVCREHDIDMVHALNATPYAMWAYFSGKPFIITTRGSDVLKVIPDLKRSGITKIHLRFLYRIFEKAFKKATFITSTSYQQKEKISRLFGLDSTEVVRTGVEVDHISNNIDRSLLPEQLQQIEFINSPRGIRELYNSKTQVEAIALLDESILKKYTFVFYTRFTEPYPYLSEFEEMLKGQPNIRYIIFKGLPAQVVLSCIKFGTLNIMIPDSDGTPNTALEAMAAKSPLIVGSFDYDADLFTDTCIRLKENSAEALAEAITMALNNYPAGYIENGFTMVSTHGNRPVEMEKIKLLYSKALK